MRALPSFVAAVALAAIGLQGAQAFCGFYAGKADANLFNEASQVVMVRDGTRTVLSMLNDYKGPLSEFVLVVPTPTALQKGQVRVADKTTFERLDAYSSPRLAEYHDSDPCRLSFDWGQGADRRYRSEVFAPSAAAVGQLDGRLRDRALGVTVEARYALEEYDIVSLSATQSDGLETWLHENGYRIPRGAAAALKPYINLGMKFFVAKVNLQAQAKSGYTTLRPLQFAFESGKFMLPMRLGMLNAPPDRPQDLIVYLLTRQGRVESSNYRTVNLPANMNLPPSVKPRFQDFYKAMFDHQAREAQNRVVFTEYFWDMAWCDPCAAEPLTVRELRDAGVFWAGGGDPAASFDSMRAPNVAPASRRSGGVAIAADTAAQPVMLTRLHVRYTAGTFPEDLMFTQTRDRQNWQTRYVVQNPFQGSVAQCSDALEAASCEAVCTPRVDRVLSLRPSDRSDTTDGTPERSVLQRDCRAACVAAKHSAVQTAALYYRTELPARLVAERQTLAQLTGWSQRAIDAMPDGPAFAAARTDAQTATPIAPSPPARSWWQRWLTNRTASR